MTVAATWLREAAGERLLAISDLVLDVCTPHADALVTIGGLDSPVGPGSTIGAVAIVNAIKVRTAELLVEQGAMPPVITRASAVGADGRGSCSTKPIESMRGGSPVRSASKEVGDGPTRSMQRMMSMADLAPRWGAWPPQGGESVHEALG